MSTLKERKLKFETLQLHVGQEEADPVTDARAVPIYQTSSYVFHNSQHAADRFALKDAGNIYGRLTNPTEDVFEKRIASLEGGVAALAVGSGAAAVAYAIQNLAFAGDHVVAAKNIYGGTYNLLAHTFVSYGINTTFVDPFNYEEIEGAIKENTKLVFIETLGNPNSEVVDIEKIAKIAHKHQIPLVIDNTFATPYLVRPIEYGADVVVHSATKFIGGHGTTIGGVIVDGGTFDWKASGKFPQLTQPDPSYHGIKYVESFGDSAYIVKLRVTLLRDLGACMSPFNAYLTNLGLETLHLRMERHSKNALEIAQWLATQEKVSWVNYPLLEGSKYYDLAKKYLKGGASGILTFGIKGGIENAKEFSRGLNLIALAVTLGDARSCLLHPATTSHSQLNEEELLASGVTSDLLRLSVGIEDTKDLINDINKALKAI